MFDFDVYQFWKDDELAHNDNCFSKEAPQVALGIRMSEECVFAELGVDGNPWLELPRSHRMEFNKRYNDKAERIVGKRLLDEYVLKSDEVFPRVRRIGEVFEGEYIRNENSEWLESSCQTPFELEKLLDRVEKLELREFILPKNWESDKTRLYENYGKKPHLIRHVRGPVTFATSIYGAENLIFLIVDEPDLAKRFSNVICDVICEISSIMDYEAGYQNGNAPTGFSFADDNCYLLNAEMYEAFGYPVLKKVFDKYSPKAEDKRYQHSDSAMGHLIPILSRLNLTGCNFGPLVMYDEIRKSMPKTRIDGCMAPFTFMNNDEKAIISEVKRDCIMAKKNRGLNLSTAGSINNGSLLSSMLTVMYAIQLYGRY